MVKLSNTFSKSTIKKTTMGVILPWIIGDFGQFSSAIALDFKQLYVNQGQSFLI